MVPQGLVERRVPVLVAYVDGGAFPDEQPDNLRVLALDGEVEGSLLVDVLEVQVGLAQLDEEFRHLAVVVEGGEVEGRVAVVLLFVDLEIVGGKENGG